MHGETESSTGTQPVGALVQRQYSLSSILWMTTAAALLMTHARTLGPQAVQLLLACLVFWFIAATLFGLISREPKEVLFWSALLVVQAFLAVTAVRAYGYGQQCGWGLVGAICGSFCATRTIKHPVAGSAISAALGTLAMMVVLKVYDQKMDLELWLDLVGAGVVGLILWYFVDFMRWFLIASGQSRAVLAAWLTLSVLVGNWLVEWIRP